MSTLTLTVIVLVVATLAGVLLINLWQNRGRATSRRGEAGQEGAGGRESELVAARQPLAHADSGDDRLVDAGSATGADPVRGEPTLDLEEPVRGPAAPGEDARSPGDSPLTGRQGSAPHPIDALHRPTRRAPTVALDPLADCIIELRPWSAVGGERMVAHAHALRRAGAKPVVFEGRAISARAASPGAATGPIGRDGEPRLPASVAIGDASVADGNVGWEPITPGHDYSMIRAGVLLANRHGPLNAMEFSEFVAEVKRIGEQVTASVQAPEMSGVLERARALDARCFQLDSMVGLNVDAPEPLGLADLARLAADQALTERGNNRYARLGPQGEVLFSVALSDAPNRLTMLLDVPRVPAVYHPWRQLVSCARVCAAELNATLVDDSGRPLTDLALEQIDAQLSARYEALEREGVPAGSAVALRLFN